MRAVRRPTLILAVVLGAAAAIPIAYLLWPSPVVPVQSAGGPRATPPVDEERVFAVGVIPWYPVSSLFGEAPHCYLGFPASEVIRLEPLGGETVPRIVRDGIFVGECDGGRVRRAFRAATVRRVEVTMSHTKVGLRDFEMDSAHPDWTIGLHATPFDEGGRRLDTGRISWAMQGYAHWRPRHDCARVAKIVFIIPEVEGVGVTRPGDDISLAPLRPGTCTIEVSYFDAKTSVTVTVR